MIRAALDKVEAGTEYDTVALEAICLSYLEGGSVEVDTPATTGSLEKLFTQMPPEDILGVFEKVFPDLELTVGA